MTGKEEKGEEGEQGGTRREEEKRPNRSKEAQGGTQRDKGRTGKRTEGTATREKKEVRQRQETGQKAKEGRHRKEREKHGSHGRRKTDVAQQNGMQKDNIKEAGGTEEKLDVGVTGGVTEGGRG